MPLDDMPTHVRDLVIAINKIGGREEILPSMYRHLANWPAFLSLLYSILIPYEKEFTIKGDKIATDYSSPIKLFEYLSSGKPIIASSLPPFSTILRNGHDALLVDPDSYEDLNKSLITLLKDDQLRLRLSENSLKLSKNFSWKKRASMMLADL